MKSITIKFLICCLSVYLFSSCEKFLDKKSNMQLSTPDTLDDLQALLDNDDMFRHGVSATNTGSDEYYVPMSLWETRPDFQKLGYIWDGKLDIEQDWNFQYEIVLTANTVLDRVDDIETSARANEIKGSALFLRAHAFFQLAQLFAPQYDSSTASTDMGIVIRNEADFSIPSERASVQQTYDQIIGDLLKGVELLPANTASNTRPNKAAGYALLARTYLQIGDYQKARDAADQSLNLYSALIDYNNPEEVDPLSDDPIRKTGILNREILFYQVDQSALNFHPNATIDSMLYASYEPDDIRSRAFFHKNPTEDVYHFKGSYVGSFTGLFTGLNTPEVYLVRAEAKARLGDAQGALEDIALLLNNRYTTGTVPELDADTPGQALSLVLVERKKELLFRGMRWADLRRLNKNPATAVVLTRNLDGTAYTLSPNDLRYTLLIPQRVMQLSTLKQNPR